MFGYLSIDDSWQRRLTPFIIVGAALLVATFIIFFSLPTKPPDSVW